MKAVPSPWMVAICTGDHAVPGVTSAWVGSWRIRRNAATWAGVSLLPVALWARWITPWISDGVRDGPAAVDWAVGWVDGMVAGATAPGAAVASVWSAVAGLTVPSDTSEVLVVGTAAGDGGAVVATG